MRARRGAVGVLPVACLAVIAASSDARRGYPSAVFDGGAGDASTVADDAGNLVGNGDASGHPCVRLECPDR